MELIKVKKWLFAVIGCFLFFALCFQPARAQTFAEFFAQKKTQKKYLLEQLAALKVYAGYVKKGYDIAGKGLNTIRDITGGEFSLHNAFISSLKAVSPAIRNNAKVAETIALQLAIVKAFGGIKGNELLSASNQQYIGEVREKVMEECTKDLEELLLVITSGKIEMGDDERIKRLDKVYASMLDKSTFTQKFINDVALLIRQRETELQAIDQLRRYYESY